MNSRSKNSAGFTLMEILIYISIFAIVGGFLVDVLINSLEINTESQSTRTVSEEGRFVLETVSRLVRDSSLIDMSTTTPQGSLILRNANYNSNNDFTHVYASGTKIYMAVGVVDNVTRASSSCPSTTTPVCVLSQLTDDRVNVDTLSFRRISSAPGLDLVQIDFTLSYNSTKPQSQFSKIFKTSIARVSAAVFDSSLIPNPGSSLDVGASSQKWSDGWFSGNLNVAGSLTAGSLFKVDSTQNYIGVGTANPRSSFHVATDMYLGAAGSKIILKSSGGNCFGISVTDAGGIATSSVTCP